MVSSFPERMKSSASSTKDSKSLLPVASLVSCKSQVFKLVEFKAVAFSDSISEISWRSTPESSMATAASLPIELARDMTVEGGEMVPCFSSAEGWNSSMELPAGLTEDWGMGLSSWELACTSSWYSAKSGSSAPTMASRLPTLAKSFSRTSHFCSRNCRWSLFFSLLWWAAFLLRRMRSIRRCSFSSLVLALLRGGRVDLKSVGMSLAVEFIVVIRSVESGVGVSTGEDNLCGSSGKFSMRWGGEVGTRHFAYYPGTLPLYMHSQRGCKPQQRAAGPLPRKYEGDVASKRIWKKKPKRN